MFINHKNMTETHHSKHFEVKMYSRKIVFFFFFFAIYVSRLSLLHCLFQAFR